MEEVYPGVNNILGHRFAGPFSNLVMQEEVQFFFNLNIFFFKLKRKSFSFRGPLCGTFAEAGDPRKTSAFYIFFQIEKEAIFLLGDKAH